MKQPIGEFLATLRKANGYTQQYVADELGISNRTLSAWEQGRTYPDILSLPALAELYGVTCDEILAGERKQKDDDGEDKHKISEKSLDKLYDNIAARALVPNIAFCALGIFGAILLLIVSFIGNAAPAGLLIFSCVFAAILMAAAVVLIAATCAVTEKRAGISPDSANRTPAEKSFVYQVRKSAIKFVTAIGGGWLLCAFITAILFAAVYRMNLTPYGWAMLLTPAIGAILLLICALVFKHIILSYPDEKSCAAHKAADKLFLKCFGFTLIPLVICAVIISVFEIATIHTTVTLYSADESEFIAHFQTVEISEETAELCGITPGEFFCDVQSAVKNGETELNRYKLGNGIYCKITYDGCTVYAVRADGSGKTERIAESGAAISISEYDEIPAVDCVYNLSGKTDTSKLRGYVSGGIFSLSNFTRVHYIKAHNGKLSLIRDNGWYCGDMVTPICVIVMAASIIAAIAVYFVMRKKMRKL